MAIIALVMAYIEGMQISSSYIAIGSLERGFEAANKHLMPI